MTNINFFNSTTINNNYRPGFQAFGGIAGLYGGDAGLAGLTSGYGGQQDFAGVSNEARACGGSRGNSLSNNLMNAFGPPANINFNFGPGALNGQSAAGSSGRSAGGSDDYVRGIKDALGQIRGKKSMPDQKRVEALLKGAQGAQQSSANRGNEFSPSCNPGFGNRSIGHHCGNLLGRQAGGNSGYVSPQQYGAGFGGSAGGHGGCCGDSGGGNDQSSDYIRGVKDALAQIRGKDSMPDQKRVEALLAGAQGASAR